MQQVRIRESRSFSLYHRGCLTNMSSLAIPVTYSLFVLTPVRGDERGSLFRSAIVFLDLSTHPQTPLYFYYTDRYIYAYVIFSSAFQFSYKFWHVFFSFYRNIYFGFYLFFLSRFFRVRLAMLKRDSRRQRANHAPTDLVDQSIKYIHMLNTHIYIIYTTFACIYTFIRLSCVFTSMRMSLAPWCLKLYTHILFEYTHVYFLRAYASYSLHTEVCNKMWLVGRLSASLRESPREKSRDRTETLAHQMYLAIRPLKLRVHAYEILRGQQVHEDVERVKKKFLCFCFSQRRKTRAFSMRIACVAPVNGWQTLPQPHAGRILTEDFTGLGEEGIHLIAWPNAASMPFYSNLSDVWLYFLPQRRN